ncbi:hypothetical protein AC579_2432 [Pseudocercospora musae]|uniref:beta-galactosidase n=1 Tax=Pseudocercospora musae TaxID=113226 RepID=A0A139IBN0_9PEZI|nr:hypothetical protein AC579_2432 [Pseudocercospora musae]
MLLLTSTPDGGLPTNYLNDYINQSSSTPYSLVEFQGGSFDPWGGPGFEKCLALLGLEFERVFYKNDFSFGGNLGHPRGYTSYDYGAVITEERLNNSNANGSYTGNDALATTALLGNVTNFFVIRHGAYNALDTTKYTITLPTSMGNITIPQLGSSLSLHSRDSKMYITDYDAVLVVYSGPGETNELAVTGCSNAKLTEGEGVEIANKNGATVLKFDTSSTQRVVSFSSGLRIHIVNHLNATSALNIIGGAPEPLGKLTFNSKQVSFRQGGGVVTATADYMKPSINISDLSSCNWKVLDSLPEIKADYDDSAWPNADLTYSNNTARDLTTPTSLYASDYGFNTGNLIYRSHFTCKGKESSLYLATQGGSAFGHSVWLNDMFIGSFDGADLYENWNATYKLPATSGDAVLTVLVDNMDLDENFKAGVSEMKHPRGILDYSLSGYEKSEIKWKLTSNLGGEDYQDRARGPLNEGGLYAERQGYHLPGAPTDSWKSSSGPTKGLTAAGVAFYATTFDLNMPEGYDIPLSFSFSNTSTTTSENGTLATAYRAQIYVNGYQFGKYVHNIGPQDAFPVPEGIFNYHSSNYVARSYA